MPKKLLRAYNKLKIYKHKSIFFRFWFLIVLGFAIVFVAVLFSVNNYNSTKYYNNMSDMFAKNMYNMRNSLDSIFAEVILETQKITANQQVRSQIEEENFSPDAIAEAENFLREVHSETEFIKSIYLYYPQSNYILSSAVLYPSAPREQFSDISWYDQWYSAESEIFLREHPENSIYQKCITICKEINASRDVLAVFNINYDKFNIIRKNNVMMEYEVSMVNEAGDIIYSSETEKIGNNIELYQDMRNIYFSALDNYTVNSAVTKDFLLESIQSKNLKMSIVAQILKKNIDDINGSRNLVIIIAVILAVILLLLSLMITTKFYGAFVGFFDNIPPAEKEKDNAENRTNEISDISKQISNIVSKKHKTESELAESIIQLQKAQSIALQSQFSPHFLFNTLQMINSIAFAEMGGDSDITTAVGLLCDILHVAMDTTEYTCRFSDELELAGEYIMLQNMKYENAFLVTYDIDEETKQITVAKLFLQPLLENSMHHGYDSRRKHMNINIGAHIIEGKLIVTVEDDGVGITEERQREIEENLNEKKIEKKDSIGLLNLNQRIKLIFGYEYGCKIENNGHGTTVTVSFPTR